MTPYLFAPGSHSFTKFFPGSASICIPPAFRCRQLSWPFFSSRFLLPLALPILDRIPRTELCSTLRFFNLSFFAVSQFCWAHLFWLSDREPSNLLLRPYRVISRFMGTYTFYIKFKWFIHHFAASQLRFHPVSKFFYLYFCCI